MAEYTVQRGDTLYGIARSHGIRYWPNVYFATQNNAFRQSHPNPDRIYPGDRVFIPSATSIAPMERRPLLVHRDVPLFTQSAETCWRATGKMLYCRRHPVATNEADFDRIIGEEYRELASGLQSSRWRDFYGSRLGMTEATIASPNDLHYLIGRYGPVIAAVGDGQSAHSMVMPGYDLFRGRWFLLDPAAGEQLDFAPMVVTAGSSSAASGGDRLTGYRTAPATWANMGRWLWILDTTVHQKVYHY